jgi:hypothetical protein
MTAGLVGAKQTPKGRIFVKGTLSIIVATGIFEALTRLTGKILRVAGTLPKEHINVAPAVTNKGTQAQPHCDSI